MMDGVLLFLPAIHIVVIYLIELLKIYDRVS